MTPVRWLGWPPELPQVSPSRRAPSPAAPHPRWAPETRKSKKRTGMRRYLGNSTWNAPAGGSRPHRAPRWALEPQHSRPVPSALPAPLPDSSRRARTLGPRRSPAGPAGQGGSRPHLAAGSAGPARGQGPIPRRIPQRRRLTAQPRGRAAAAPPARRALRRARSRGPLRAPAGTALPTGLGRAEPPKAQGGGGAERLGEPCEGKEAGVTGQRRSRSKQTPAACLELLQREQPGPAAVWGRQPSRSTVRHPWKGPTVVAGGWRLPELLLLSTPRCPERTDPEDSPQ